MKSIAKAQNDFTIFKFGDSEIRVINKCGEPWFVAKDVCDALNLTNSRKALTALDDDEKGVTLSYTLGGEQNLSIVSESGMYTLVLRCRDAVNKGSVPHKFRKWVTAEVLPSIRKTGSYGNTLKAKKALPGKITTEQQEAIKQLVMSRGQSLPKEKQAKAMITMWSSLKSHFGCSYREISEEQFTEALSLAARVPLEGELIGKQEKSTNELSAKEANSLVWLWDYANRSQALFRELYPALKLIQSGYSGICHDYGYEFSYTIWRARGVLINHTRDIDIYEPDGPTNLLAWEMRAEMQGEIVALVHSHPGGLPWLSEADRRLQIKSALPWWLVCRGDIHKFRCVPHLTGRRFEHGVTDCYTLFRDAYHLAGIDMPDFHREDDWWRNGQNLYLDNMEGTGFYRVPLSSAQAGDILLCCFGASVANHAAIYCGNGELLHHLPEQLSKRERYSEKWQRRTHSVWRHRHWHASAFTGIYNDLAATSACM